MDVGVDVGGTFTDFVGFRGRAVVSAKLPSSKDPAEAVPAGMRQLGAEGMSRALRDLPTSVSHEVLAEFREFERSSTTALDAYIKPLVRRYLESLAGVIRGGFYVMKSSGGVVPHQAILRRPVEIVVSGPAGGVAAAVALARLTGSQNLLTFDMGGTSAVFSTIVRGAASWTTEALIDTFPIALPILDIESVGAGGGSLSWLDTGRALPVGP